MTKSYPMTAEELDRLSRESADLQAAMARVRKILARRNLSAEQKAVLIRQEAQSVQHLMGEVAS